jgi:hypothetical protein
MWTTRHPAPIVNVRSALTGASMTTKLDQLKAAAAQGDWQKAIAIAARFPQLGKIRNAVLDAHTAYTNPGFLSQLGRDPEACKLAGQSALIDAYRIKQ